MGENDHAFLSAMDESAAPLDIPGAAEVFSTRPNAPGERLPPRRQVLSESYLGIVFSD
jgi:hypothetical protein